MHKRFLSMALLMLVSALGANAAWSGELKGRVADASGDIGLGGASVKIPELNRTTNANDSGYYRLANLPAGEYTLVISYPGTSEYKHPVRISG